MMESALEWLLPDFTKSIQSLLYPFRLVITAGVLAWLWLVREKYFPSWKGMPASSIFLAVAVGAAVIVFWIVIGPLFRVGSPSQVNPIPQDPLFGVMWLMARFAGAVVLAPIIEELFWRSFLSRRFDADDFEKLDPREISLKAILATSVAFALGHGEVLAGVIAGIAFCWLYKRRGDLREAVLAHAVANALLFAYVVKYSAFEFWG
jgi:uncharacterized protein